MSTISVPADRREPTTGMEISVPIRRRGRSDEEAQEGDWRGVDSGRVVIRAIAAGLAFAGPACALLYIFPGW
jgi:hypothetical protein